jgi:hypothetical protein
MKRPILIYFSLMLLFFLATGLLGCSHNNDGTATIDENRSGNELAESELPPGKKIIIDDPDKLPVNTIPAGPVAGTGKEKDNTTGRVVNPAPKSRLDVLKKVYKNLMVFHADDTMEVNKPKLATLILAKDASAEKLKMEVLEESNATDESLKTDTTIDLGSRMKAKLIAFGGSKLDNSFDIEPLGSEEQSFRNDRKKIIWQWKITPLKEGQHELKLSIQIIEKDGEAVYLPARNIPVIIFAKKVSFFTRVGNFVSEKYEWILSAIFIPIFIAWLSARIRFRNNPPPKSQS